MIGNYTEKRSANDTFKVCLVLKDRGWILEKFAIRLTENLPNWNVNAKITFQPSATADINHWMWYCDVEGKMCSRNTIFITHVDRPAKWLLLRGRLRKVDIGICASRMTMEDLVSRGIDRRKLCFITPAHDGLMKPRRIVLGITSRVRPDKAKRENFLIEVANHIRLDAFHFEIIGRGWDKIIPRLESAGDTVRYHSGTNDGAADYRINVERVPTFDYYLYLGFDEGSMGFLDALAAGVPTIVTPQGFHLDVNGGITHAFSNADQLANIFHKIADKRNVLTKSVEKLTWNEYARQHAIVWRAILTGRSGDVSKLLHETTIHNTLLPSHAYKTNFLDYLSSYGHAGFSTFYEDLFMLWEWYTGKKIQNTAIFRFLKLMKRLFFQNRSRGNIVLKN